MGDWHFCVCKTCKETCWLTGNEPMEWVMKHRGHDFYIFFADVFSDDDAFEKAFREFMGWNKEEGNEDE